MSHFYHHEDYVIVKMMRKEKPSKHDCPVWMLRSGLRKGNIASTPIRMGLVGTLQ